MKNDFVSRGRAVSDLKAHLVLTTKYRRKAFTGVMLKRLHEILYDLCQKWGCKLIEFNGEADHVHLLFQYYPQMDLSKFVNDLSKFVNNIKSVSSRRIRHEFKDQVDKIYWKDVLWNESYFIASCGGVTVSVLRQYIENQNTPASHPDSDRPPSPPVYGGI